MVIDELESLNEVLARQAVEHSQRQVILAPGREPITYGELYRFVTSIGRTLRSLGIGRNTQVAVVFPNGPEIMVAQLGVAAYATVCPLNPKYLAEEFSRYLTELEARALIVGADGHSQAEAAAEAAGIPVLYLDLSGQGPLLTGREGQVYDTTGEPDPARSDDLALLIHTSGTTGRPKIVPLTQHNLQFVAEGWLEHYRTGRDFRLLNVLPLFHVAGLLSIYWIVLSGGSMICPAGFDPARTFDWLAEFQPTSLGCAPSMLPPLLALAEERGNKTGYGRLEYILSGSAALSPALLARIEATFGVHLIDNYGSSEANGLTSNGSIDIPRKAGSVGKPTNAIVAIMDDRGELVPPGQRGEVVARGPNVMSGYWRNPEANETAFRDGWFRTGDQGYLDEDGYLFLTGRIKELINRGGEKISPYEVEEAMLAHPAVAQAAAFALPHPVLGEVVAAAVVLKEGAAVSEAELRSFMVQRLVYFKIPSKFIFTTQLPRNALGKIERLGLAAHLGLNTAPVASSELDEQQRPLVGSVEAQVFEIWSEALGKAGFGLDANFFDLGGTSLEATSMITLVQQRFARLVTVTNLVEYPTLRDFSLAVRRAGPLGQGGPLQALQAEGTRPPFFIVHGADGYGYHYHDLGKLLAPEIPVYAFTSIGRPGQELLEFNVTRLAGIYVSEMRKVQPRGPYRLAGHSSGGILALEMASLLVKQGEKVSFLGMFDSQAPRLRQWYTPFEFLLKRFSLPFTASLASALQPEAYAFFTGKAGDGAFSEERVARLNWLEATWYLWHYLRREQDKPLPKVGKLPGEVIRKVPVKYRTLAWNLSELAYFHQAQEITNYLKKHPESMQRSEVKALVRAAWQAMHIQGLFLHRSRPYMGEVVVFQVEEKSMVRPEVWQQAIKGKLHFHKVRGDHGNHIRLPFAVDIADILRRYLAD